MIIGLIIGFVVGVVGCYFFVRNNKKKVAKIEEGIAAVKEKL